MVAIKRTIALLNHQPIMLEGLIRIFGGADSLALMDFGLLSAETIDKIVRRRPDLVLLDSDEQDRGTRTISRIVRESPGTKVGVFASAPSVEHAVRSLEAGAAGYVSTTSTADELREAVKSILDGETFITQKIATKVITSLRAAAIHKAAIRSKGLTVREVQIGNLLMKGRTNRQIAEGLGLSEKTVKHYLTILMQKLEASNRLELALVMRNVNPAAGQHLLN
ncbi:response regulator transcription factor [Mesorhizobium sp. YM1C-6-2]|uniref:response regulator transcription factor n=1 Tax=Mesorhizobium sp. YM1C-6-2 TaxID=1827501 RepID=UPI000EF216C3|nr:response regulator transcription factor [Mesorhizobium sp. YM1C-6-2]RLP28374.1 DNA-binding response regulator [Mesorhizobium sp. YM1C-6-2]